jgi:hypothetical protein
VPACACTQQLINVGGGRDAADSDDADSESSDDDVAAENAAGSNLTAAQRLLRTYYVQ